MSRLGYLDSLSSVCRIALLQAMTSDVPSIDIVDFEGSTMIECPQSLHPGAEFIISLSVNIKAAAFKPPSTSQPKQSKYLFSEGQESEAEQILRQRKASLLHLFEVLDLKPITRGSISGRGKGLTKDELTLLTKDKESKKAPKKKTEIVGDGEEVEVEADVEELSDNQLNLIYRK